MTVGWTCFLNRLDFGLKRVELCEGPSHADQINRLLSPRNFGLDNGSLSSPLLLSLSGIEARTAPPMSLRLTSANGILREKSVSWLHPLHRERLLTIAITRRIPASFNKAEPPEAIR